MYVKNDRSSFILDLIESPENISVVADLGCNDGATLNGLKKSGMLTEDAKFHGFDYSDIPLKTIDFSFYKADLNGDLGELSLVAREGVLILLLDVLEHLHNPELFLSKLNHILKENTEVVITVPNASSIRLLHAWLKKDFPRKDIGFFDRTHRSWFSKNVLTRVLKKDFKILKVGFIFSNNMLYQTIQKFFPERLTSQFYIYVSVK